MLLQTDFHTLLWAPRKLTSYGWHPLSSTDFWFVVWPLRGNSKSQKDGRTENLGYLFPASHLTPAPWVAATENPRPLLSCWQPWEVSPPLMVSLNSTLRACVQSLLLCATLCPPGSSIHRDSPGKNTGVGYRALLQGIFLTQGSNSHLYVSCVGRWILFFFFFKVDSLLLIHQVIPLTL